MSEPLMYRPLSIQAALARYPEDNDDDLQELWDICHDTDWLTWTVPPRFENYLTFQLNVGSIYRAHKTAGYRKQFARFILEAMYLAEDSFEENFDPLEEKRLCAGRNWFKTGGAVLFRTVGPWTYDRDLDDYILPQPMVRGELSYFRCAT